MFSTAPVTDKAGFERDILAKAKPAVLRGLARHWPATQAGMTSPEALRAYLLSLYNQAPVPTIFGPPECQGRHFYDSEMRGFNFQNKPAPLDALLDKMLEMAGDPEAMAIYAGSVPASSFVPDFARENVNPLIGPDIEPRLWIGNRSRVAAHFDADINIACVVAGMRRFILFPPDQIGNLYIGPLEFTMAGPPASLVDFVNPDFERFPKFRDALNAAIVVDLEPGDALFIPPLWWHHVEAPGPFNMLVNYWWQSVDAGCQMPALALSLLALRERPLAERQAWRSYFDHYVFGDDAAAAGDHIPQHAKGALGPALPERNTAIRSFVVESLRG
jgi:Cupin-like domain